MTSLPPSADVVVVGAGNAAMCAALAARDAGASVVVLERAPVPARGGNTAFTAGAMRVAYDSADDIAELVPDLTEEDFARTDFGSYPADQFLDDLARVTDYRCDPDLAEMLVNRSLPTLQWMRTHGVRFMPIYGRQAFEVEGRFRFWGGLTLETWGGGPGLVDALARAAEKAGVLVYYESRGMELLTDSSGVRGVRVQQGRDTHTVEASSVVLASGGFQANPEWRTRYLGPGWDLARVRGTRYNFGDGIRMALEVGAMPWGNWSGAHAVGWDYNAPHFGDLAVGDGFQKHSYPFGVMVNSSGERFVDEGADFRNYTYAKYGREILAQPGQMAWQVFDDKVAHLLRDEYRIKQVTKVQANSIEDLGRLMDGMNVDALVSTVAAFNAGVDTDVTFDPNVKDGKGTTGVTPQKSNWANTLDSPPYTAFAVTCGITFTFGGIQITPRSEVLDTEQQPIPGLYAAGELVGGLFYSNYPGGSGLTAGAVFGRIAGEGAAAWASK